MCYEMHRIKFGLISGLELMLDLCVLFIFKGHLIILILSTNLDTDRTVYMEYQAKFDVMPT